jgi:hypothetical protein
MAWQRLRFFVLSRPSVCHYSVVSYEIPVETFLCENFPCDLYCTVLYCIVLYCIVLYCIVLYCIVLYCIVLYCIETLFKHGRIIMQYKITLYKKLIKIYTKGQGIYWFTWLSCGSSQTLTNFLNPLNTLRDCADLSSVGKLFHKTTPS